MKLLYLAAAFLIACFALSALAQTSSTETTQRPAQGGRGA
jgi:hypothetical protein